MKHILIVAIYFLISPYILLAQSISKKVDLAELISKMTLEQKAKMVIGKGMRFPGAPDSLQPAVGKILDKDPGAADSKYNILAL